MNSTTIFNSYSIALPTVRVAATAGSSLLARGLDSLARRVTQSILEQPQAADALRTPHWSVEAGLRQQGMRDWLSSQHEAQARPARSMPCAAEQHKKLWLELVA